MKKRTWWSNKFALTARSLKTFNMLVACDAAGIIYDITKIFLEIYQGIGVPGKPLGKRFELDLLQIPFLGCKDQREE